VSKSRCSDVADRTYPTPGEELADTLKAWLDDGTEPAPVAAPAKPAAPMPPAAIAEAAATVADAANGALEADLADEATRKLLAAAKSTDELTTIVANRITPLRLAKGSPRRARLLALYTEAEKRLTTPQTESASP
jgi:hypothetical protein